jgi:energy-coupling factor transporter ATP-binding protein EcfA2
MKLRPSSDHARGVFVSVDGPSGAGKSTIVSHLAQMLVGAGEDVHVTAEPSTGPIGVLCRELTETVTGHALACLYAADRYHHLEAGSGRTPKPVAWSSPTATSRPAWSCSASTALTRRSCGT